jgi:hypothetical protein
MGGGKATLSFTLVNYICKLFVALVLGGTLEDQITLVLVKKGVIDCEVNILTNFSFVLVKDEKTALLA